MDPVWGSPAQSEPQKRYHSHLLHLVDFKSQDLQEGDKRDSILHQDVMSMAAEEHTTDEAHGAKEHQTVHSIAQTDCTGRVEEDGLRGKHHVGGLVSAWNIDKRERQDPKEDGHSDSPCTRPVHNVNSSDCKSEMRSFQPVTHPENTATTNQASGDGPNAISDAKHLDPMPSDGESGDDECRLRCNSSLTDDSIEKMPPSVQSELRPDTPDIESAEALFLTPGAVATSTPKVTKPHTNSTSQVSHTSTPAAAASEGPPTRQSQVPSVVASSSLTMSPDTTTLTATAIKHTVANHHGCFGISRSSVTPGLVSGAKLGSSGRVGVVLPNIDQLPIKQSSHTENTSEVVWPKTECYGKLLCICFLESKVC